MTIALLVPTFAAMRRLPNNDRGNVAVTFALALLPMIGVVGLAVDYGRTQATKARLDSAADAAALAAATEASTLIQQLAGQANASQIAVYYGQQAGLAVFRTNATTASRSLSSDMTPDVQVVSSGRGVTASVTYQASQKNVFGPLFKSPVAKIAGSAKSSLQLPSFMNISVAVDVSQSMGLAATATDMSTLRTLTPDHCAFGCHVVANAQLAPQYAGTIYRSTPYEKLAHDNNVQLRIDVIQAATKNMISTAKQVGGNKISFNLYTMQYGLNPLPASSTDYDALITAANGIDLGPNNSGGTGDSNFVSALTALTSTVPLSGDGSTFVNAQQFLFLMTDGVQDVAGPCGYGHCTQALDPATCAALKAKGVTVGVIYTTYLAMPEEASYRDLVQPFAGNIASKLTACASPGWYYEASDATDIQNAVNTLFNQATNKGLLTQ